MLFQHRNRTESHIVQDTELPNCC